jgi:hypothetical protein
MPRNNFVAKLPERKVPLAAYFRRVFLLRDSTFGKSFRERQFQAKFR